MTGRVVLRGPIPGFQQFRMLTISVAACGVIWAEAIVIAADQDSAPAGATVAPSMAPPQFVQTYQVGVWNKLAPDGSTNPNSGDRRADLIRLNYTLSVTVNPLDRDRLKDPQNFVLILDGVEFKGLNPRVTGTGESLAVHFELKRTDATQKQWQALMSLGLAERLFPPSERSVKVSLRDSAGKIIGQELDGRLQILDPACGYVYLVLLLVAIAGFVWLAVKSDVLRDIGPTADGKRKPFSLARTQMAVWFFVIIAAYMFIWIVTNDLTSLTGNVLALMGISAATGLAAVAIDTNKANERVNAARTLADRNSALQAEVTALSTRIAVQETAAANLGAGAGAQQVQDEIAKLKGELAKKNEEWTKAGVSAQTAADVAKRAPETSCFLLDILSDENGVSFHRFQMFGWTIALVVIFIASVKRDLAMPEFKESLLGLMGISGGTYLGFKLPEKVG